MKKIMLLTVLCAFVQNIFAQKETFDLVTYTAPKNWVKDIQKNLATYTITNKITNSWCRINIVKSTASKGSIEQDFENEWQELIVKNYKPTEAPQLNEPIEADGWKIKSGAAKFTFNNSDAMALLTTATGYNLCVSIVTVTNSQDYIKEIDALLASVELIKPETNAESTPAVDTDKNSIIGTWSKTGSVNPSYGDAYATSIAGYSKDQYTFFANGTYTFFSKTFGMSLAKILLVKENGTYQISGNNITITPQKSVIEAWSKKDGVDKWGKFLSSQKRTLEKITYQLTKHYFAGIQIWNLVLQNKTPTQRDGPHSNNKSFDNAWFYAPLSNNNLAIDLPPGAEIKSQAETPQQPTTTSASNITLIGTWGKGNSVGQAGGSYGRWSYSKEQYIFNNNGTYSFVRKVYREDDIETFLTRETGTFIVNGNRITLSPSTNVIEAWSKKNGGDNFNQLRSQKKKPLEKTTYQFSVEYEPGLKQTSLLLIATATERDGTFNATINNSNGWRYGPTPPYTPVKMPN